MAELLSFFPINPSPTASETETIIMNVTMPNNGQYESYRPDALSAALGYVAHVVHLLSGYLGVSFLLLCYLIYLNAISYTLHLIPYNYYWCFFLNGLLFRL